ncbi:mercuric transport protein MerTP [Cyclobacteriaceae bacterium]|jgi:mercuric ion transport protein|nr:mercuric transport protein MerTP [Cyclobacteriaceae bacterium]|tara:strand:+ start:3916 stop:4512 length:597 start_codon:yes stop_codon:yes gene_type:complete
MKSDYKFISASLLGAVTASLCCITPFLTLIAGTSSLAATFSWIAPYRPYLIGLTLFVLGISWYQKLSTPKEIDGDCRPVKPRFIHSKPFLGIVTVVALLMLAFPYYFGILYPDPGSQVISYDPSMIHRTEFKIDGMTCSGCEAPIVDEVNQLKGILHLTVSYDSSNAIIAYDPTQTNEYKIEQAINASGYQVIDHLTH